MPLSTSSSKSSHATAALVAAVTATAVTASTVTYYWTKRAEQRKLHLLREEALKREAEIKAKTALARSQTTGEPPGELLDDVFIDRVFLWTVEDLRQHFPSDPTKPKIENTMQCLTVLSKNQKVQPSSHGVTHYNKLITNHECIIGDVVRKPNMPTWSVAYVRAGPRKYLHFDPKQVNACIVTCGGLCPGLNNVIRELTLVLIQIYGIGGKVYGIRGGYAGFYDEKLMPPVDLTPDVVDNIHHWGGTFLGSSRGGFDREKILKFIHDYKISQVYVIGGDGTHRGAFQVHQGCMEKGWNVAVAGIPKTIDNDVDYIDHSFGFSSAVEAAQLAIRVAKTEAVCNLPNGIGIVKLMGRSSGFIAAHATMASSDVDLCLVPEVPTVLEGEQGCLPYLFHRVKQQGYAVVVVAEGAGEEIPELQVSAETDASGNKKLPAIGEFIKHQIEGFFKRQGEAATCKYIDPSYTVRSVPANAADSLYCMQLAQNAVHGAMTGFTGFSVGLCNNKMVLLPIPELVRTSPRRMNPHGRTWERVLALTRQPNTVAKLPPGTKDTYDSHGPTLR